MYADDLVLLSETPEGLQNCLNKLSSYCSMWGLEINKSKSKILIFNNTGRLIATKFHFNNTPLDHTRSYSYLGVKFNISGSFTDATMELYKKGLKAFFKVRKCFENCKPKLRTLIHIFDHTIKPVLLYGSEIWGAFLSKKLLTGGDNFFFNLCKNFNGEKVHVSFCKYLLSVSKRSTNLAVMGELGRYPLMLDVLINMIKYYVRLSRSSDVLLSDALQLSSDLHQQGKKSWIGCIHALLQYINVDEKYILNLKSILKKYLFDKFKTRYNIIWKKQLFDDRIGKNFGNKLRTYRTFKYNFTFEPYLNVTNPVHRNIITKFRISDHSLEVERGRYKGLEFNERICKLCNNSVEDEIHYLLQCPSLTQARNTVLEEISNKYVNFKNLDNFSKFTWLMTSEDVDIIQNIYKLLNSLADEKSKLLASTSG